MQAKRRIPVVATIVVIAAVATMIGLGVWQLQRLHWKEALLTQYAAALDNDTPIAWPTDADRFETAYFRRSSVTCATDVKLNGIAGRNAEGESGWVHIVSCMTPNADPAAIQLGWSRSPEPITFSGGSAKGRIAPYGDSLRLVADPPLAGLEANAAPDPRDIPNNHFAYAMQWFFFAGTALIIYGIALRRRVAQGHKAD
nr:SURF1 family protein [Croceicoccus naphthovorans]